MIFFFIFDLEPKQSHMRTFMLFLFLIGTTTQLQAQQSVPMYQGAKLFSIGIGYPSQLTSGWESLIGYQPQATLEDKEYKKGPVIQISAGKGMGDYFSLSAFVAVSRNTSTQKFKDQNGNIIKQEYIDKIRLFGLRGQYHLYDQFNVSGNFDPYVSLGGGLKQTSESLLNGGYDYGIFFMSHIGAKYYLSDKLAIYGELGLGTAFFNTGLSIRL